MIQVGAQPSSLCCVLEHDTCTTCLSHPKVETGMSKLKDDRGEMGEL